MAEKASAVALVRKGLSRVAATIGPGLFILGYTIGTGSVTTMASSGAEFGMSLTWAIGLSCLFTYVLIVSISRVTIAADQTLITSIKEQFGRPVALFLVFSLLLTALTSVMGITGIVADVVRAWTRSLTATQGGLPPVYAALFVSGFLYLLFWTGSHQFFLRAIAVIVAVMALCFVSTMLIVVSRPVEVIESLQPAAPPGNEGHLILAGMVGTTMASVVIVTRTYLVDEQGWSWQDLKEENRDAIVSLSLTFLVSAAIIASAAGTMYPRGLEVGNAIDMVQTLEPLAGRFAASVFVTGLVAAGLSSLFPSYVLGPWLIADYLNIPRDMSQGWVRVFVFVVAATGLVVPVFGGRPVTIMIASQAVSPAVMPLIIVLTFALLNTGEKGGKHKGLQWINGGLIIAFIFSLFISYSALVGLVDFIHGL
jgi:Mn2+/Fe2+ NRAMP family transporter